MVNRLTQRPRRAALPRSGATGAGQHRSALRRVPL